MRKSHLELLYLIKICINDLYSCLNRERQSDEYRYDGCLEAHLELE